MAAHVRSNLLLLRGRRDFLLILSLLPDKLRVAHPLMAWQRPSRLREDPQDCILEPFPFGGVVGKLILREQIFQIRRRQAAGKAFLAEDVGDGLRFALLQFPNLFFDSARRDEPIGVHGLGLANAM